MPNHTETLRVIKYFDCHIVYMNRYCRIPVWKSYWNNAKLISTKLVFSTSSGNKTVFHLAAYQYVLFRDKYDIGNGDFFNKHCFSQW